MAKKNLGEQMDLIPDLRAENAKEIARLARRYKKAQDARSVALNQELDAKKRLLAALKESKLKPMDDGVVRCHIDGLGVISVTPRDELVKVKFDDGTDSDAE